jgi:hypothetical protein
MPRKSRPGWTSRDIREVFDMIVEEHSLTTECQHSEHMVDITEDTDQVIPLTDRIMERYTRAHIRYNSESTNDDFAEDLTPKEVQ